MPSSLQLGPLVLPVSLIFMLVAVAAATSVGKRAGRRVGVDIESILYGALAIGIVVARLAFVLQFSTIYLASPLDIVDIRDGGWRPLEGFAAAWLFITAWLLKKPALRKPLLAALVTSTVIWGGGLAAMSLSNREQQLPALSLTDLRGGHVDLVGFIGKPTVVNLWATWCPPCVREMPVLLAAQTSNPATNFVFINQGESAQRIDGWLASRKLSLVNVLVDTNSQALASFKQQGLPATLFFDAKGRLMSMHAGELSAATLTEKLKSID